MAEKVIPEKSGVRAALEKARERRLAVLNPHNRRSTDQNPAAEPPPRPAAPAAPAAPPKFPEVALDSARCRNNRVLLPTQPGSARAPGAAEYRMLRTRVLQRARANSWRTIGVTSPGPGDGKSLTAINLTLAISREQNNTVFLIDLDMRNPKMCEYFGAEPPTSIVKYLMGRAAPSDVFFTVGIDNLVLAGTTMPTDQSSELLATEHIDRLFAYIFEIAPNALVLLDLPPILSTDDALVIAPKIDASLLVVSEGWSRRDSTAKAIDLLSDYNLAGLVLNRSHAVVKDYYSS